MQIKKKLTFKKKRWMDKIWIRMVWEKKKE